MNWAHPRIRLSGASLLTLLLPVLSIIGASIFLDEPITSLQVPGIGIVLTAFVLTIRHNARVRELTEVQP